MSDDREVALTGYLPLHYRRPLSSVNGDHAAGADKELPEVVAQVEPSEESPPEVIREGSGKIESWSTLLDAMQKFDRDNINIWNDELGLLLIYSGMFSIVITVFAVKAQELLQADPDETSVVLLSQIASQLSIFTTGNLSAFAPPSQVPITSIPFSPSQIAVTVNILWVISLALSILVAFFSITIQQWLRRVPVPRQISIREAIRLRQFRYIGLRTWHVQTIISFLPAVLQVSVVLFLVGLICLVQSLNHSVLLALAIVLGIALFFYVVSAVVPAVLPGSPYKSLFLPLVLIVARAVIVPLVLFALLFLIGTTYILGTFFSLVRLALSLMCRGNGGSYAIVGAIISFRTTLMSWLRRWMGFRVSDFTDLEQFWSAREQSAMSGRVSNLDGAAVSWAPYGIPQLRLQQVTPCFPDLNRLDRTQSALEWAGLYLGDFGGHDLHDYSRYSLVNPKMLSHVQTDGGTFAQQHRDLLLSVLPKDWSSFDYMQDDPAIAGILILLLETLKAPGGEHFDVRQSGFLVTFARLLMAIRDSQVRDENADLPVSHFATSSARIPTSLLFTCCEAGNYAFDRQEAIEALEWATRQIAGAAGLGVMTHSRHIMNILELVIGSSATAFIAFTQHPTLLSDDETRPRCRSFFIALDHFLDNNKGDIKLTASICAARPAGTVHVVFRDAIVSIAQSLIQLLESDWIPMGDNCPSGPLYGKVLDVCRDEATFEDAMPYLQRFYDLLMNRRVPDIMVLRSPGGTRHTSRVVGLNGDDSSGKMEGIPEVS